MRLVVMGAGGIGGVLGARLHHAGHDVVLVARGPHHDAIAASGLRVESPDESSVHALAVVDHPGRLAPHDDDVVQLPTKSQHTDEALEALVEAGFAGQPLVCVQNGVDNERAALRRFPRVYGCCVMAPTTFLEPGVVQAHSAPVTGILDLGRYPSGSDALAADVAAAFAASTFSAEAVTDIMRWKYAKLLKNLGNAVEALCEPSARRSEIGHRARLEGIACFEAAGIAYASEEEDTARRAGRVRLLPAGGRDHQGGSSWQSLRRKAGSIETDYLNGEIALLGRLHGVATPVNSLLQRLAGESARSGGAPGTTDADAFLSRLP
jgi:2-dehydropantoate 2-reductase